MSDQLKTKLFALQTLALWILVLVVIGWLIFKPDNSVSKETIDKLTIAVENMSDSAEKMTRVANAQREWVAAMQASVDRKTAIRDKDYDNLYEKYGYNHKAELNNLDSFYDLRLQRTENIGSANVRGNEDGTSKAGTVQKSNTNPQG